MSAINDGGRAFPVPGLHIPDVRSVMPKEGMTLRDYLAAHAPAEPQPWFEPAMPPRPTVPPMPAFDEEERRDLDRLGDWIEDYEVSERVLEYARQRGAAIKAQEAWDLEKRRQRYIQWPWAWADAMLAEREKEPSGSIQVAQSKVAETLDYVSGDPDEGRHAVGFAYLVGLIDQAEWERRLEELSPADDDEGVAA